MKYRSVCAILLCAALLLSAAACGSSDTPDNTDTTADTAAEQETTPVETEPSPYDPGLPERDFGGEDFLIAVRGTESDYVWDVKDVQVDTITGDPVNDAIYERTSYLNEKYNVNIDALCCGTVGADGTYKIVSDAVMTNDTSFQVVLNALFEVSDYALDGLLIDLNSVENLNLSQSWWDQNMNKECTMGNRLYFTTGDLTILDNEAISILLFDKSIVEDYSLDDPYQDVLDGNWTMEKMLANCEAVTTDLDGNGSMNEDDRFGYIYWQDGWLPFLHSMGNSIGSIEEDGTLRHNLENERIVDSWALLHTLLTNGTSISRKNELDLFVGDQEQASIYMLERHNVLYVYETVAGILRLREMETDFGILPYPKLNAEQDRYYCSSTAWGSAVLCIPTCNPKTEEAGFIMEAYAAKSAELLTPAYYDVTLTRKGVRDEKSVEMLEIISGNVKYDIGAIYDWGEIGNLFVNAFNSKKDNISSTIKKFITKVETDMQANSEKLAQANG